MRISPSQAPTTKTPHPAEHAHRHTAVTTHDEAAFHLRCLQPPGRTIRPDGVVFFMPPLFWWMRRAALRLCGVTPMEAPPCLHRPALAGLRVDREAWLSSLGRTPHSECPPNTALDTQRKEVQTASWSRSLYLKVWVSMPKTPNLLTLRNEKLLMPVT